MTCHRVRNTNIQLAACVTKRLLQFDWMKLPAWEMKTFSPRPCIPLWCTIWPSHLLCLLCQQQRAWCVNLFHSNSKFKCQMSTWKHCSEKRPNSCLYDIIEVWLVLSLCYSSYTLRIGLSVMEYSKALSY